MAHENKVVRSVNLEGELQCVDIFRRPDGSFGFELYRRDPEDGHGWYPVGFFGDATYASETAAVEAACNEVPWLHEKVPTAAIEKDVASQRTRK